MWLSSSWQYLPEVLLQVDFGDGNSQLVAPDFSVVDVLTYPKG